MPRTAPTWSPSGNFLVYTGPDVGTTFHLKAITPAASRSLFPISSSAAVPGEDSGGDDLLVTLRGDMSHKEFWELNLKTGAARQLTDLGRAFLVGDLDVSPDGREIVYDRAKEDTDLVLIDLPAR